MKFSHLFVEKIPDSLETGVLYVSIAYATALHLCPCGCGNQVVTPFEKTGWALTFDGEAVSLTPSVGNWSFPCQSHYWFRRNRIIWCDRWSREEIDENRARDARKRERYYGRGGET